MKAARTLALTVPLLAACAEWPRHEYLPDAGDALPGGEDPGGAVEVFWTVLEEGADENDLPTVDAARVLDTGRGYVLRGRLDGAGWEADAVATSVMSDTGCESTNLLPPVGMVGNYASDVDWMTVRPSSGATLCGRLEMRTEGAKSDLLAYRLDGCAEALQDDETGAWLGVNTGGHVVSWSTMVAADVPYGLVAGGLSLNAAGDLLVQNYVLTVALVASSAQGSVGLCPDPDIESLF